jgi:hypothetical protein
MTGYGMTAVKYDKSSHLVAIEWIYVHNQIALRPSQNGVKAPLAKNEVLMTTLV